MGVNDSMAIAVAFLMVGLLVGRHLGMADARRRVERFQTQTSDAIATAEQANAVSREIIHDRERDVRALLERNALALVYQAWRRVRATGDAPVSARAGPGTRLKEGNTTMDTATIKTLYENLSPPQQSAEVSQNAKGELTYTVKVYSSDEHDAVRRAAAAFQELREAVKPQSKAA